MGGRGPSAFGPSFVLETTKIVVNETSFRKLFKETFAPWIFGTPYEDLQWQQLRTQGQVVQNLNTGVFQRWGEIKVYVTVPRFVRQPPLPPEQARAFSALYDRLPNQEEYHYVVIQLFKPYTNSQVLGLIPRDKLTAEVLRQRQETFRGILKAWIRELRAHFVWGDGEFTTLKKHDAEDSRLRVWGYNFYSGRLVDAIGRDRFAALAGTGAWPVEGLESFEIVEGEIIGNTVTGSWSVEDFEGGVLLLGDPDPYAVPASEKTKAARILGLRERLGPILPPKPPPPDPDPRPPPPKGVVE